MPDTSSRAAAAEDSAAIISSASQTAGPSSPPAFGSILWRSIALIALAGVAVFFCLSASDINSASESGIVMRLPEKLDPYTVRDMPVSEGERVILPEDTTVLKKSYENGPADIINCQIVLAGAEKRSIHRPEVCLPAQGWSIAESGVIDVPLHDGTHLPVKRLIITRPLDGTAGSRRQLKSVFLYWFVGKNTTTPEHSTRVFKTTMDRIFHGINHRWAYIVVSAPVLKDLLPDGRDEVQTQDALEHFIAEAAPTFMISKGAKP